MGRNLSINERSTVNAVLPGACRRVSSCVFPFRRLVSSCTAHWGWDPHYADMVRSPLVLPPKATFDLEGCQPAQDLPEFFRLIIHTLDTRHTMSICELISIHACVCHGHRTCSLSPLQRSSYCRGVDSLPHPSFSVVLCPSFHASCPTHHTWPSY